MSTSPSQPSPATAPCNTPPARVTCAHAAYAPTAGRPYTDTRPRPCKLPTSSNLVSSFPMHMPTSLHAHQSSASTWCTSPRHAPTDAPRRTTPTSFPLVRLGEQSLHLQAFDSPLCMQAWPLVAVHHAHGTCNMLVTLCVRPLDLYIVWCTGYVCPCLSHHKMHQYTPNLGYKSQWKIQKRGWEITLEKRQSL